MSSDASVYSVPSDASVCMQCAVLASECSVPSDFSVHSDASVCSVHSDASVCSVPSDASDSSVLWADVN